MIERQAKINASVGRHKAGTPTPAVQGAGPSVITGTLRRSIHTQIEPGGLGTWTARIGPSAIYGRRVELEFDYPYMRPALDFAKRVALPVLARRAWGGAMR